MTNYTNLTGMELDEASLEVACGGFGWHGKARGQAGFGLARPANRPFNVTIDIDITVINVNGDQNIVGGQDVTLRG